MNSSTKSSLDGTQALIGGEGYIGLEMRSVVSRGDFFLIAEIDGFALSDDRFEDDPVIFGVIVERYGPMLSLRHFVCVWDGIEVG